MIDGLTHTMIIADLTYQTYIIQLVAGDNSCAQAFVETIQDKLLYQNVCIVLPTIGQILHLIFLTMSWLMKKIW